jgi:hypothetical protein
MALLPTNVADHVAAGRGPVCSGANDVCAHSLYVEAGPADQALNSLETTYEPPNDPT